MGSAAGGTALSSMQLQEGRQGGKVEDHWVGAGVQDQGGEGGQAAQ